MKNVSFSASAKAEVCREQPQDKCCFLAQCYGILLFCNSFHRTGIKIITESQEFAKILPRLFRKAFGFGFDVQPEQPGQGKMIFQIIDPGKLQTILEAYGFEQDGMLALHVNLPVVEEDCCRMAFFRGAFLAGGSVTDPGKGYHLELATIHQIVARECFALIHDSMGFSAKTASRSGSQVLYFKQSEQISDFLTYLGAPVASMGIIEARLEKELNNKVNRRCNCDDANISKVVEAAQEQLNAIRILQEAGRLDTLPAKLRLAAEARQANPEATLTELAAMMDPPITKPAMNHRLKKIAELAKEAAS